MLNLSHFEYKHISLNILNGKMNLVPKRFNCGEAFQKFDLASTYDLPSNVTKKLIQTMHEYSIS